MRLGLFENGVEAAEVSPLVGKTVSREAKASPSSLGRGALRDVL